MTRRGAAALALARAAACGGGNGGEVPDAAPARPAWSSDLPPASVMGERRGLVRARGLVHLHSPYSHDACDGAPGPTATPARSNPIYVD